MYLNGSNNFNAIMSQNGGRTFKVRFKCDGTWYESGIKKVVTRQGSSNDPTGPSIGSAIYAGVEITMDNLGIVIEGKEIELQQGLMIGEVVEYIPVGVYIVQQPKEQEDGSLIFNAYDRMSQLESKFEGQDITFPASDIDILSYVGNKFGFAVVTSELTPNAIASLPTDLTYREVIGYIAGLHGRFAIFDRQGQLSIRWYSATTFNVDPSRTKKVTKTQRDFEVGAIACVIDTQTTLTAGTGINGISIENPLMTQEKLDAVFSGLNGFTYRPLTVSFMGDIRLDPWDIITVSDLSGLVYDVPVMSLTNTYDGGVVTDIQAYGELSTDMESSFQGPTQKVVSKIYKTLFLQADNIQIELGNKVSTDSLITSINASKEGIKIQSKRLDITGIITAINNEGTTTIEGNKITTGSITSEQIKAGSIDASVLNIGIGQKGGYALNPLWKKWNDGEALPVGTFRWGDTGRVDIAKISEYGETYLQLWNEQAGLQIGVGLAANFFVNPTSIQGVEYFGLEAKFRLTWGTDPAGASFLIDITYQDNTQQRFSLDFTKKGRSLVRNQWYVVRQVFAKETTVPVKTISGYVLGNWVGLGATSAKTIQIASVDCYRATEQDYLTQMWNTTNTTTINGGNITTGSITADKINVTDLFAKDITMSGKLNATSTGFVYPEVSDANLLSSFIQGTATPTAYQKTVFDFDKNGTLNLLDWLNIRALVMRQKTIATVVSQTGYTPINTPINVRIDPSNADKVISISGTNSFGTAFERYFGASGMATSNINAINVNTDSINAATMNTSGDNISNYFIANNAKGFYCKDTGGTSRAIAFLGADNITYLAYDIGYTYDVIMGHRSNTNEIHLKARYWIRCGEDTQGFIPNSNGLTQLGLPSFRWSVVYSATGTINTSDRSMKTDISTVDDRYVAMLDLIVPSTFKMIDGTSGRTHAGWVADNVEDAMLKVGLSAKDFAGFCKDKIFVRGKNEDGEECDVPKLDENGNQVEQRGLRYEEFIPLLHEKIRRLEQRIKILESA